MRLRGQVTVLARFGPGGDAANDRDGTWHVLSDDEGQVAGSDRQSSLDPSIPGWAAGGFNATGVEAYSRARSAAKTTTLREAPANLWQAPSGARAFGVLLLVELRGFEPLTSAMRTQPGRLATPLPSPLFTVSPQPRTLSKDGVVV